MLFRDVNLASFVDHYKHVTYSTFVYKSIFEVDRCGKKDITRAVESRQLVPRSDLETYVNERLEPKLKGAALYLARSSLLLATL